ncbi:hypothetical protein [Cereibacter changlensis]|uniref:hypothetical protein n=1 Tax=Cereibacter changlensis TaxID=402884 RepID=UPI004034BACD
MSTKQSTYFKGNGRREVPTPKQAGTTAEVIVSHTFTENLETTDVLELFGLIPYGKVIGLDFMGENLGAVNLSIGLMSGTPGSIDPARTSGAEYIAAAVSTTPLASTLAQIVAAPRNGDTPRSIGVKTSAQIVAGPTKKLHVRIRYAID